MKKAKKDVAIKKPMGFISVDRLNVVMSRCHQRINEMAKWNKECHDEAIKSFKSLQEAFIAYKLKAVADVEQAKGMMRTAMILTAINTFMFVFILSVVLK